MSKIFIASPTYGDVKIEFVNSIINMVNYFNEIGQDHQICFSKDNAILTDARNALVTSFLQSDCTHILFIDCDIGFNPESITDMLETNRSVICGMYAKKYIVWERVLNASNKVSLKELSNYVSISNVNLLKDRETEFHSIDDPVQVDSCGLGFMMVSREVIEKILPNVLTYVVPTNNAFEQKYVSRSEFFKFDIDRVTHEYVGEDIYFCELIKKYGEASIYLLPSVELAHIGKYSYRCKILL